MFYIRTIYTDCSRAYRIGVYLDTYYHSAAKSEKETSQLAAGSWSCTCGHNDVISHIIWDILITLTRMTIRLTACWSFPSYYTGWRNTTFIIFFFTVASASFPDLFLAWFARWALIITLTAVGSTLPLLITIRAITFTRAVTTDGVNHINCTVST